MKKIISILFILIISIFLISCEEKHIHNYNKAIEDDKFLKSKATCSSYAIYYWSCECENVSDETFEGEFLGEHEYQYFEVGEVGHVEGYECIYCHKKQYLDLPRIDLYTDGKEISEEYIDAKISVSRCLEKYELNEVDAQIKIRGNGSAEYDKKPFRIKFNSKQMMLGLNDDLKAKSWVLINEYNDRSRMRNFSAFFISNYLFNHDGYYCTDMRFVEVYINGKYNGLYLLAEQQQINKGRVDINEVQKDYYGFDIGYLIELDTYYYKEVELETFAIDYKYGLKYTNGKTCRVSKFQNHYTIKSDIYSYEQNEFIKKVTENIFFILYDSLNNNHDGYFYSLDNNYDLVKDYNINSSKEAVSKVLDLDSYVDMFIIQNIAQNVDIGWSSFYMSFDASSNGKKKLVFEAPWDFDWAMGSAYAFKEGMFCIDQDTSGRGTTLADYVNPWMLLFANTDWFIDLVQERWIKLKETNCFIDLYNAIDILSTKYASNFSLEFNKYPDSLTKVLDRSKATPEYTNNLTHYSSAMYLKQYIQDFEKYYDSIWLK